MEQACFKFFPGQIDAFSALILFQRHIQSKRQETLYRTGSGKVFQLSTTKNNDEVEYYCREISDPVEITAVDLNILR